MDIPIDPTVGLPLGDLRNVPTDVRRRLDYLFPPASERGGVPPPTTTSDHHGQSHASSSSSTLHSTACAARVYSAIMCVETFAKRLDDDEENHRGDDNGKDKDDDWLIPAGVLSNSSASCESPTAAKKKQQHQHAAATKNNDDVAAVARSLLLSGDAENTGRLDSPISGSPSPSRNNKQNKANKSLEQPSMSIDQLHMTRQRVLVLTYGALVLCDATAGDVVAAIPLPHGLASVSTGTENGAMFFTFHLVDSSSSESSKKKTEEEHLLSSSAPDDVASFLKHVQLIYAHHTCKALEVTSNRNVSEELASNPLLKSFFSELDRCSNGQNNTNASNLFSSEDLSFVPWTHINRSVPVVQDRMSHVKELFSTVDRETKDAALRMRERSSEVGAKMALTAESLSKQLSSSCHELSEQIMRAQALDNMEQACQHLLNEIESHQRDRTALQVQLGDQLNEWHNVQNQRQGEEIAAKRRLTKQQATNAHIVNELNEEAEHIRKDIHQVEEAIALYTSDEYQDKVQLRDDALLMLEETSNRLADAQIHDVPSARQQKKLSGSIDEVLATNRALRKVLADEQKLMGEEHLKQKDLRSDVLGLVDECKQLRDREKELLLIRDVEKEKRNAALEVVETVEASLTPIRKELESLEQDRKYLYLSKQRNETAVKRRSQLEKNHQEQRSALSTRSAHLQQQVFEEKLKLDLERRWSQSTPRPGTTTGVGSQSSSRGVGGGGVGGSSPYNAAAAASGKDRASAGFASPPATDRHTFSFGIASPPARRPY